MAKAPEYPILQFLYWKVDQGPGPDQYKRGEVIAVQRDDQPWGKGDREEPRWGIVRAHALESIGDMLTKRDIPSDTRPRTKKRPRRIRRLDVDKLTPGSVMSYQAFKAAAKKK